MDNIGRSVNAKIIVIIIKITIMINVMIINILYTLCIASTSYAARASVRVYVTDLIYILYMYNIFILYTPSRRLVAWRKNGFAICLLIQRLHIHTNCEYLLDHPTV